MNFGDIFRLFVRIKRWFGTKTSVFFASRNTNYHEFFTKLLADTNN